METRIISLIQSNRRNKVIFYSDYIFDFDPIDLGVLLSQFIYSQKDYSKLPMQSIAFLNTYLSNATINHSTYGSLLSISNLGILFEKELKINVLSLFESLSKNNTLFIKWEGEVDGDELYFLNKKTGIKLNIKELSCISI
jgi:hypothetical protein